MNQTTQEAFLADIIANPADDTPRLIFADWLEENGQETRGRFIREAIRVPHCSFVELTRDNPFPLLGLKPRGFVEIGSGRFMSDATGGAIPKRDMRTWMWGEMDVMGCVVHDLARHLDYRVDHGFISQVGCHLEDWINHGKDIAPYHPITYVHVYDRQPDSFEFVLYGLQYQWWHCGDSPFEQFKYSHNHAVVTGHLWSIMQKLHPNMHWDTIPDAKDYLSRACIILARQPDKERKTQ